MPQRLLIATRNRHKTEEIAAFLGSAFIVEDLTTLDGFEEVEETGTTFLENAILKATAASRRAGSDWLVLADDSGLEVNALQGAPGVRSARFAGDKATDRENLELLLEKMSHETNRAARFRCVIAAARDGVILDSFDGACEGILLTKPCGNGGFGYDPIFRPIGMAESFAELSGEMKNRISHRANALGKALDWLRKAQPSR